MAGLGDGSWLSWGYHVGEERSPFFSRPRGPDQPPEDNERMERGWEMTRLGKLSSVGEHRASLAGPCVGGRCAAGHPQLASTDSRSHVAFHFRASLSCSLL